MQNPIRLAIVIAAATALTAFPAQADAAPPPMVSVTGEATISAPPDVAQIEAGVTTDAKTAREAAAANNDAMGKILLALKSAGIPEKDYQTSRLSLQPQIAQSRASDGAPQIAGYRASNRVTIKLRDVGKIAGVIDAVTAAGANDIGGINFMVSNASKLLDDARAEAVTDARRKAEIFAKAAGVSLGAPLSISEHGAPAPVMFRAAAPMAAGVPIAPGEETLRVTVGVSWEIKAAP